MSDKSVTQWKPLSRKTLTPLEWSPMTPQSQLIFNKLDSAHSRTEECKNHSHAS
jgi:hypothetical protein